MKKKISYLKKCNKIYLIIFLVASILLICSTGEIIIWFMYSEQTELITNEVLDIIEINELKDSENTIIVEQEYIEESNIYWDYISTNYIDVDIEELKKLNSDTVGWIKVEGTNINYPIVSYSDNDYYLTHSFDKTYNTHGWIFSDYRNSNNLEDRNLIIYGHSMTDSTMFGTLVNVINDSWLNDESNFLVRISTLTENTVWQVFSTYKVKSTTDYLQVNFSSNNEFLEFSEILISRSVYDFNTSISENDNILTLSTCSNSGEYRIVLHAKLIKSETKV